ncbi:MAG: ThuA domain-containing protein [Saprospiraceae bacterium]|nr:ThuA domain-containing protein [Saprospiraceae bacterium]
MKKGIFLLLAFSLFMDAVVAQKKPLIVFVAGDHEYGGEQTLPLLAAELEKSYNFQTKVLTSFPNQNGEKNIPGLEALKDADLAVFYLRWRQLVPEQLALIEEYLKTGKPVMGFRTTTHAFNFPKNHPSEKWNAFGEFALNAPPGWGGKAAHTHYGHESSTDVSVIEKAKNHPILTGVEPNFHVRSWLYRVLPDYPTKGSEWLLMGKAVKPDKAAIENPVAWIGTNSFGAKIFTTTMGHPEDFSVESFQRLLVNAIHWELGLKIPKKWKGNLNINVPYRGMVND